MFCEQCDFNFRKGKAQGVFVQVFAQKNYCGASKNEILATSFLMHGPSKNDNPDSELSQSSGCQYGK